MRGVHNTLNLSIKDIHVLQGPKCSSPILLINIHFEPLKSRQPLYKGQYGWSQIVLVPLCDENNCPFMHAQWNLY